MKHIKKFLLVFVIAMTAIVLIGCTKDDDAIMHTVVFANTELVDAQVPNGEKLAKPSAPPQKKVIDLMTGIEMQILLHHLILKL